MSASRGCCDWAGFNWMRKFRLPTWQNSLNMRSLICFAVKLPPRIFSYKPHNSLPINTLLSDLTGPYSPARLIFSYRANLSLSLAITFHRGAFGVDLNLTASNLSLSLSIFFLFFILYFFAFSFPFSTYHLLYPIYRIFIFSVFFCGFLHEKTASTNGCCKFSYVVSV